LFFWGGGSLKSNASKQRLRSPLTGQISLTVRITIQADVNINLKYKQVVMTHYSCMCSRSI